MKLFLCGSRLIESTRGRVEPRVLSEDFSILGLIPDSLDSQRISSAGNRMRLLRPNACQSIFKLFGSSSTVS